MSLSLKQDPETELPGKPKKIKLLGPNPQNYHPAHLGIFMIYTFNNLQYYVADTYSKCFMYNINSLNSH